MKLTITLSNEEVKAILGAACPPVSPFFGILLRLRDLATERSKDVTLTPISSLGLNVRARRGLEKLGCQTLGDVLNVTADDLLSLRGVGHSSVCEVRELLKSYKLDASNLDWKE